MKLIKSAIFTVVGSLFAASSSLAVTHLDQNQNTVDDAVNFFTFSSAITGAQSFQQSHGNIVGAGIFLKGRPDASDIITLSIYDKLPTEGGSLIVSGSDTGHGGSWLDVYWPEVAITQGATYFLVFSSNDPKNNGLGVGAMEQSLNDFYPTGNAFATVDFIAFDYVGEGTDIGYDIGFRTYYDDGNRNPTHNTPDGGSTLAILGLSLTLLGAVRSKR